MSPSTTRSGHPAIWRDPKPDEVKAWLVEDSATNPPALHSIPVIAIGYTDTRVILHGVHDGIPSIGRAPRGRTVALYEAVAFTPAAAWARYIEQQESIIEDLKREVATREGYREIALHAHAQIGPSGSKAVRP